MIRTSVVPVEQTRRTYQAGEVIFEQGSNGSSMISVISGSVSVIKDGVVIARRGAGEFLGEMSLLENTPRFATIVAESTCEIAECTRQEFLEIVKGAPAFALQVMKSLSHKLRESDLLRIQELEESNLHLTEKNRELSTVNKFLEHLIEQSPAGIIIADGNCNIKRANPAALQIFENQVADLQRPLTSYFEEINPVEKLNGSSNPSWAGELKIRLNDQIRTLFLSVSRLQSYDDDNCYLFICEDISEMIWLNEQIIKLERFATKSEITSGIAHDIKNYLMILRGNFELIQLKIDETFKQRFHHHILAMEKGFQEIERFVENLMLRKGESSNIVEKNLDEMIRVIVRFLAPQLRFQNIKIITVTDPAFPKFVHIDEAQFQQILMNLLINAADALGEIERQEEKEIRIDLVCQSGTGVPLLMISDNGPGIPSDRLAELFSKPYTTKKRGHGIGLITVKKIVDQHQGKIEVESTLGVGTKFIISLPR